MKYECILCSYSTDDKSNYNKHTKSIAHTDQMIINNNAIPSSNKLAINANSKVLIDCQCGKSFSHKSSFSRHKKVCQGGIKEEIIILKKQLDAVTNECKQMKHDLLEYSNNTKTVNITNNISIKKYIQQNYSDAPVLTQLADYSVILDNNDGELLADDELINNLIYNHNHKNLYKYLGDFLVKYYKKKDSTKQSIWNSDVSRMTYIIKELLADKKSLWNHDYKGIKTKQYIINPLLQYVKKYITDYIDNYVLDLKNLSAKQCQLIAERQLTLGYIMQYIDNGLPEDIVKYIAPHFHLDKQNDLGLLVNIQ